MLQNVANPIRSLKSVKNKAEKFKKKKVNALTSDKYDDLLIQAAMTHDNKFKWDDRFSYKYRRDVYDIEQLPNYGYWYLFDIEYYVDMIQSYDYQK